MRPSKTAVFLINLVQDVNILRPLIFMASRDFGFETRLLISSKFLGRDMFGIWQSEVDRICEETGATHEVYDDEFTAFQTLTNRSGLIFAGSDSNLSAHSTSHNVLRSAPPGFIRIVLQHGFECVGFRHSGDHVRAHGTTVSFGADIVCSWYGGDSLTAMSPSQRTKLHVTGPTAVLQMPTLPMTRLSDAPGLVCENLHSVRLNISGDFKSQFVKAFEEFCALQAQDECQVTLRPHPGGQYVLKNKLPLPENATINNAPMYRVDLRQFSYGISAPSSVLIDMLLADIPTAVWRDGNGVMDSASYDGLTEISSPAEWNAFSKEAVNHPDQFIDLQRKFLQRQQMPLDPRDVYERFARLFQAAERIQTSLRPTEPERDRVLFIANGMVPTLQLSFLKPLAPLFDNGSLVNEILTEVRIREEMQVSPDNIALRGWLEGYLTDYAPSIIVFCRYSGPASEIILSWAHNNDVPVIYHIDDDLLNIPADIGERKSAYHNHPDRVGAVSNLMTKADLVYASTERLNQRFSGRFPGTNIVAGRIYCSGSVLREPEQREITKVGYMASADHAHNLDMILPAIVQFLDRNPDVVFELFGSIPVPTELERFGERISTAPPIANYDRFLQEFSSYGWDIGICPLTPIDFNLAKANTKWVEYTAVGTAVIASRDTVYDGCCEDGCGILAETQEEWLAALELLARNPDERIKQISRAQEKLNGDYTVARLREQVLHIFDQAKEIAKRRVAA
ncbi:glycosyltransferase [Sphingobium phenoxybenzoativorans]|uniref:Glycosyltransferase n=1 Tax=Sphingobium phenoxybenzoativorans TaxID=1592790 RepID=A0A975K3V7_9SPHN|nr:glycosyltransferase [Sphingobium phenoxybenzoativorans]QUT04356.1 glycosyltransferase [Sphingobium phenoxybenzoativorans]